MTKKIQSKSEMQTRVAVWIKTHAKASGLKDEEIATRVGMSRDEFNKLKNNRRNALWHEVVLLAQVFGTDAPVSLILESSLPVRKSIALRNSVAVGVWREEDRNMALSARLEGYELPSTTLDGLERFARRVDDGHADLFVPEGFHIVTVDYAAARQLPRNGDYVVIERRRRDLSETEKTVSEFSIRRLTQNQGKWTLEGKCSKPDVVNNLEYTGPAEDLEVIELIVARLGLIPDVI